MKCERAFRVPRANPAETAMPPAGALRTLSAFDTVCSELDGEPGAIQAQGSQYSLPGFETATGGACISRSSPKVVSGSAWIAVTFSFADT